MTWDVMLCYNCFVSYCCIVVLWHSVLVRRYLTALWCYILLYSVVLCCIVVLSGIMMCHIGLCCIVMYRDAVCCEALGKVGNCCVVLYGVYGAPCWGDMCCVG